jgi:hypothetical protein
MDRKNQKNRGRTLRNLKKNSSKRSSTKVLRDDQLRQLFSILPGPAEAVVTPEDEARAIKRFREALQKKQ